MKNCIVHIIGILISIVLIISFAACQGVSEVKPFISEPTPGQADCMHVWESGICSICDYECGHQEDIPYTYQMADCTEHFVVGLCSCGIEVKYREEHKDTGTGCSMCEYDYSERLGDK